MKLNELSPAKGAIKKKKRIGRGESSGTGKTAGRGHKGQKARSGGYHKLGFEGGQMPLQRRLPKRGFTSVFKKKYALINISQLAKLKENEVYDEAKFRELGLVKNRVDGVRILGKGDISISITVKASHFSKLAKEKIEKASGKAELIKEGAA